jgi:hypothetical protein
MLKSYTICPFSGGIENLVLNYINCKMSHLAQFDVPFLLDCSHVIDNSLKEVKCVEKCKTSVDVSVFNEKGLVYADQFTPDHENYLGEKDEMFGEILWSLRDHVLTIFVTVH